MTGSCLSVGPGGTFAYFAITEREYFSKVYPECGPPLLPALGWPSHSPDLSVPSGAA